MDDLFMTRVASFSLTIEHFILKFLLTQRQLIKLNKVQDIFQ